MAIVENFWLKNQRKKLAGAVVYQAMGQTRSRELAASVSNPRTVSQMNQRVKWANLVNFYRANASWMKFAYETKKQNQTDYNKFMSLNVSNSRIYLPKQLANQGACIVDEYQMTQGSLGSIEVTPGNSGWDTNIFFSSLDGINTASTVGEVSQRILPANPAIREGDQLSFIRITQQTNSSTGVPFVVVRKYEVIINSTDIRRFYDFMPEDYIVFVSATKGAFIRVADSGLAGGFLLILSRTVGGKTYVSTQSIIVANNEALINAYSSSNALQAAIDSYGESAEPFLTSTTADVDTQAAVRPSIVSVRIGSQMKTPGQRWAGVQVNPGGVFDVTFSGNVNETLDSAVIVYYADGTRHTLQVDNIQISGANLIGTLPQNIGQLSGSTISEVEVSFAESVFRAIYIVTNEDTEGGLE